MKKLTHSFAAKVIFCIIFVVCFLSVGFSSAGALMLYSNNSYAIPDLSFYDTPLCASLADEAIDEVINDYFPQTPKYSAYDSIYSSNPISGYEKKYSPEHSNFFFTITDSNGEVLLSNNSKRDAGYKTSQALVYQDESGSQTNISVEYGIVTPMLSHDNFYGYYRLFNLCYSLRYTLIWIDIAAFGLMVFSLFFLVSAAGYRKNEEKPQAGFIEKIPFDIYLAIWITINILLILCLAVVMRQSTQGIPLVLMGSGFFGAIISISIIQMFMTVATRLKTVGIVRKTMIFRVARWVFKPMQQALSDEGPAWKLGIVFWATVLLGTFFAMLMVNSFGAFILWLILTGIVFRRFMAAFREIKLLSDGIRMLANGHYDYKTDLRRLHGNRREHGENLNHIAEGMSQSLSEKVKNERFKAELITNVSHDLKTPLTSIINYIDLLKREETGNEKAKEYIEIIDRNSQRLKKLTTDLVEASKASSGTVKVNFSVTNVSELLRQAQAEFADRMAAKNLTPVLNIPDTDLQAVADGRLLWRVFDNLLANVCKYSQDGTRVYFDVSCTEREVTASVKNVSREPLSVNGNDLTRRFVRGDASRSTEGSGLGLSIARSLTEIQHGTLKLDVDGDLFKASVTLPKIISNIK